jgi:cysteine desulfurase
VREGLDIQTLRPGGGQEKGRRSGTENVAGIAGFAAAAKAAARDLDQGVWDGVRSLRDALEARILAEAPGTVIAGAKGARLPNTSCLVTPGWKGETQVMQMDLAGFAVSAGSACSSGKVRTSRVLKAMGFDDLAAGSAIRVSIGASTTGDEILRFADAWLAQQAKFRARAA